MSESQETKYELPEIRCPKCECLIDIGEWWDSRLCSTIMFCENEGCDEIFGWDRDKGNYELGKGVPDVIWRKCKKQLHYMIPENIYVSSKGYECCRACKTDSNRKWVANNEDKNKASKIKSQRLKLLKGLEMKKDSEES